MGSHQTRFYGLKTGRGWRNITIAFITPDNESDSTAPTASHCIHQSSRISCLRESSVRRAGFNERQVSEHVSAAVRHFYGKFLNIRSYETSLSERRCPTDQEDVLEGVIANVCKTHVIGDLDQITFRVFRIRHLVDGWRRTVA
jgi:hypothetical protein